jgi:hypothetical protein
MKTISNLVAEKFPGDDENTLIDRVVYRSGANEALDEFRNYCKEEGFWNSKLDEYLEDMKR